MMYEETNKIDHNIVQIVSIDDTKKYRDTGVFLPDSIYKGDILIRNPFEKNIYITAEEASLEIRLSKFTLFSEVAQRLGATHYKINEATEVIEERKWSLDGKLNCRMVESKINIKNENDLKNKMGILIEDDFPNNNVSIQEAEEFAEKYNLSQFTIIRSLIRQRGYENNRLEHRTLSIDASQEANKLLDAAFTLSALGGRFYIDPNLNSKLSKRETINLTVEYNFA